MRSTVELPPIRNHVSHDLIPPFHSPRPRELLPSILNRSPTGRSSTLPPIQRREKPARPRKSSITQNSRKPKHERTKSKDHARRLSVEGRKAFSAEPQGAASAMGKRWEELIEAATSANEADSDRDMTPVSYQSWVSPGPQSILLTNAHIRSLNLRLPLNALPSPHSPPLWPISILTRPLPSSMPSPHPGPLNPPSTLFLPLNPLLNLPPLPATPFTSRPQVSLPRTQVPRPLFLNQCKFTALAAGESRC